MNAAAQQLPVPESLDDLTAYGLIEAITIKGEAVGSVWVDLLAKWALAKAERVDELEDKLAEFKRTTVRP